MPTTTARIALLTRRLVIAFSLAGALASVPSSAQVVFEDGDFAPANWDYFEVLSLDGGTISSEAITDGNPGDALRITTAINEGMGQIWGIWFWHEVYDPAVSGAVGSFDYAEDVRGLPMDGRVQATGIALRQGPKVFVKTIDSVDGASWYGVGERGIVADDFAGLVGAGPPDLSATGAPIEVGFYRSVSHRVGSVGPAGTHVADIDNWSVTVRPPCASDEDCGDPATCTVGTCTDGVCSSALATDFATVDALLASLLARVRSSPCGGEEVVKKVGRKLGKRLTKARKRLAKADATTKERKIPKLVAKTQRLLEKARIFVGKAATSGLISTACGADLTALLDEILTCLGGLPLPL